MKLDKYTRYFLIAGLLTLGFACDDDDEMEPVAPPVIEESPNVPINNWISAVMNEVYFWLDDIKGPIDPSSAPSDYFEALLNRPTDRFSVIYPNYSELINSLSGVTLEAGYEFTLYLAAQGSENVIAEISYVKRIVSLCCWTHQRRHHHTNKRYDPYGK